MIFIGLFTVTSFSACINDSSEQNVGSNNQLESNARISSSDSLIVNDSSFNTPSEFPLTDEQINGLTLMREEEKLARDVYITLGEKWDARVFQNISKSEQKHMDAIKKLLDIYELEDPAISNEVGVFTSPKLDSLYKQLIAQGEKSLLEALLVGATIEDLDIKDLTELSADAQQENIKLVYNNLNRASRNHMRAFMRQIKANGGDYTPQFISQEEFNTILATGHERGNGKKGKGKGKGKRGKNKKN